MSLLMPPGWSASTIFGSDGGNAGIRSRYRLKNSVKQNLKMDTTAIKTAFDSAANLYDRSRRQLIPCFDEFYGRALALIAYQPQDRFRVLDLGAGTGLLSFLIAEHFTHAHITLLDLSEAMLAQAKAHFPPATGRFEFVTADDSESLPGHDDVVVSALSIHHLTDPCKKE